MYVRILSRAKFGAIILQEFVSTQNEVKGRNMQGPLRGIIAGVAAWKLGGGCLSTIAIFLIVFYLLGFANC